MNPSFKFKLYRFLFSAFFVLSVFNLIYVILDIIFDFIL